MQLNTKKTNNPVKNGQKTQTDISPKTCRWLTNMKRCSIVLLIKEVYIKTTMRCYLTLVRMAIIKKIYKQ